MREIIKMILRATMFNNVLNRQNCTSSNPNNIKCPKASNDAVSFTSGSIKPEDIEFVVETIEKNLSAARGIKANFQHYGNSIEMATAAIKHYKYAIEANGVKFLNQESVLTATPEYYLTANRHTHVTTDFFNNIIIPAIKSNDDHKIARAYCFMARYYLAYTHENQSNIQSLEILYKKALRSYEEAARHIEKIIKKGKRTQTLTLKQPHQELFASLTDLIKKANGIVDRRHAGPSALLQALKGEEGKLLEDRDTKLQSEICIKLGEHYSDAEVYPPDEALHYFSKALVHAKESDNLNTIDEAYVALGKFAHKRTYDKEFATLRQRASFDQKAEIYIGLGKYLSSEKKDLGQALRSYKKALEFAQQGFNQRLQNHANYMLAITEEERKNKITAKHHRNKLIGKI